MPKINYRPTLSCPASSVSDHHSAQIGDIEAFMAVGCPGAPQCLDIFLPQKGHGVPGRACGRGAPMCHLGSTMTSGAKSLSILGDN